MKAIKYLALFTIVVLLATTFMGIYTVKGTIAGQNIPGWSGGILQFDGQFVAATDTFYFPFNAPRPKNVQDTIAYALSMGAAPKNQTGTGDTVDVYWGFQFSDDNSNWSTLTQIGTDSTKTGVDGIYTWTRYILGVYGGTGIHPYYRVVAIGKSQSGGAINVVGNLIRVYALRQE